MVKLFCIAIDYLVVTTVLQDIKNSPFGKYLQKRSLNIHSSWKACTKLEKCMWNLAHQGREATMEHQVLGEKAPCIHHTFSSYTRCKHHRRRTMYPLPCLLTPRLHIWKMKIKALNFKSVFPLLCLNFQFDLPMYLLEYFYSLYFGQVIFFHYLFKSIQYFNSC